MKSYVNSFQFEGEKSIINTSNETAAMRSTPGGSATKRNLVTMNNSTPIYYQLATTGIIRKMGGYEFKFAFANNGRGGSQCSVILLQEDIPFINQPSYMPALVQAINAATALGCLQIIRLYQSSFAEYLRNYHDDALPDLLDKCEALLTQTWWDINQFGDDFSRQINKSIDAIRAEQLRRLPPPPVLPRMIDPSGYVYLLKSPSKSLYKIGYTAKPDNRLATFKNKLPFNVQYVCLIKSDDMRTLEKRLHRKFADKRSDGEWFALTVTDVAYIKALANGVSIEDLESGRYLVGNDNLPLFDSDESEDKDTNT